MIFLMKEKTELFILLMSQKLHFYRELKRAVVPMLK